MCRTTLTQHFDLVTLFEVSRMAKFVTLWPANSRSKIKVSRRKRLQRLKKDAELCTVLKGEYTNACVLQARYYQFA